MVHSFDGYNHLIRLERGERLSEVIERFFTEAKIEGGWVSGLGAASEVTLGFYNLSAKDYKWRTFGSTMEIVSLGGNIAYDEQGKLILHLHGSFANDEFQVVGGHIKDLVAGATVELFVHQSYLPIHRQHDEATGLQLLNLG
jgi:predicted DNA-binding protein with PD1-like motif